MKKIVLTGMVMFAAFVSDAQTFKQGETVEVNKDLTDESSESWAKANIVGIDRENDLYSVRTSDKKIYRIPFSKERSWMRRPMQSIAVATKGQDRAVVFSPSSETLKQKIREQFEADFSEYDSVIIVFDNIESLSSYKNTDDDYKLADGEIYPFNADFIVRLVSKKKDGTERRLNWQFKRKYLLYQDRKGRPSLSIAEKEEEVLSKI